MDPSYPVNPSEYPAVPSPHYNTIAAPSTSAPYNAAMGQSEVDPRTLLPINIYGAQLFSVNNGHMSPFFEHLPPSIVVTLNEQTGKHS